MQETPFFSVNVVVTPPFCNYWLKLTSEQRTRARKKIKLLAMNPRHPGLRTHLIHSCPGKWGCSLSKTERLVYSRRGHLFVLHAIGGHSVIDEARIRRFDDPA